ncbi:hypothetical protein BGZ60DRAFT_283718 [Tricladium varicosporioides]|nr:hypothetical protein BGZ60DRAFT_283718 [Hymenoscyphus varicosporioides]
MRRKNIAIILALPSVNAVSLANFQQITSLLIPLTCQTAYDNEIPSCTVSDFQNGCSSICVTGLKSQARSVTNACADVTVNANTLLGRVKAGGIVEALCVSVLSSTTSSAKVTVISPSIVSSTAAVSVTIPTGGAGVTGGLGTKTSSTSVPIPQTQLSSSKSSSASIRTTTRASTTATTTLSSANGGIGGDDPTSTTASTTAVAVTPSPVNGSSSSSSTKTSATASKTAQASNGKSDSGGGSPFDIQSSGGSHSSARSTIMALLIITWAGVLLGR